MKAFLVTTSQTAYQKYTVFAESEDEARSKFMGAVTGNLDNREADNILNSMVSDSWGEDETVDTVEAWDEDD